MIITRLGVIFFLIWFVGAGSLMLTVGNLHQWWHVIPLMGYGTAMGITLPAAIVSVVMGVIAAITERA